MKQRNPMIRKALAEKGYPLWYLEKILNRSGSSITRLMRDELPEEEQKRIIHLIETYVGKE